MEHSLIIEIHSIPEVDIGNSNKVSPSNWVRKKIGKLIARIETVLGMFKVVKRSPRSCSM